MCDFTALPQGGYTLTAVATADLMAGETAGATAGRMDGLFFATIALVAADFLVKSDFF
jgi:hypothetical protein